MPEVTVDVAGRSYRIGCGEGEEVHLVRLAELVDNEASRLGRKLGQMTEGRLMLMSALMLADKLADAEASQAEAERPVEERARLMARHRKRHPADLFDAQPEPRAQIGRRCVVQIDERGALGRLRLRETRVGHSSSGAPTR